MVPSTVIIQTYSICSQSLTNSFMLLLQLTPDSSKSSSSTLPMSVSYTSLSPSHFSSLNIKSSYAKRKRAGLWSKRRPIVCSHLQYSLRCLEGSFLLTQITQFLFSTLNICTSIFHCYSLKETILQKVSLLQRACYPIGTILKCVSSKTGMNPLLIKIHILLLVNTMNICV